MFKLVYLETFRTAIIIGLP